MGKSEPIFSLKDFINPVSEANFLKEYWSENFLHLPKGVKNVEKLFSWQRVNNILSYQRLPYPKIRLMGEGGPINRETYVLHRKIYGNSTTVEQLDAAMINHHLSAGASLVLNGVDEMDSLLRSVCQELGRVFKNHTAVNAYIAFKDRSGFPIHWDDHETLIVQIDGKKHWKVYGPSRIHPLRDDIEGNPNPPNDKPLFDKIIEAGDVLYIPRGFWHVVTPIGQPSLHLTFSVEPAIGFNWLQNIIDGCLSHQVIRQNIPIFSGNENLKKYQSEIKEVIINAIKDSDLEQFLSYRLGQLTPTCLFSLPTSIDINKFHEEVKLKYSGITSTIKDQTDGGDSIIYALGYDWQIAQSVNAAMNVLLNGNVISLGELLQLSQNSKFDYNDRVAFFHQLLYEGFIEIVE